ncbi:carboxypeptidase regulatory-like domain-containing protein [Candidatus Poribacteria bacterium]|nr:carboxypeptidase regulatory-like domain-containing protein [Candidatus Poribacteria bacterium]
MKRLSLILALCALSAIPMAAFAQAPTTGTIRGNIVDTTEARLPIEGVRVVVVSSRASEYETTTDSNGDYTLILTPGRYLVCIYKAGYGDRTGKPVTVVAGGDHYVPMKMTKKAGLSDLLLSKLPSSPWSLPLILIGVFLLGIYVGRRTGRRTDH